MSLVEYDYCASDYQLPEYDEKSLERHVRSLAQAKLSGAPGGQGSYSDLGFEVLGDVIAKVSGQSFEAYTQEHIFAPLDMQHTTFLVRDVPPESLAAPHVVQDNTELAVNSYFPYSRQHAPSSHLFSNVEDMTCYALALLDSGQLGEASILPATACEEMWSTTHEIDVCLQNDNYGLGWCVGDRAGHRVVDHGGMDVGFQSEILVAPDDGLAVVVMTNRDYGVWDLGPQVMQWLLEAEE
jgi:CubicO group peptidase (beta-lactamase class C family)